MSRTREKRIRADMQGASRAEIRRVRRGRQLGVYAGQGHGARIRQAVETTSTRDAERSLRKLEGGIFDLLMRAASRRR